MSRRRIRIAFTLVLVFAALAWVSNQDVRAAAGKVADAAGAMMTAAAADSPSPAPEPQATKDKKIAPQSSRQVTVTDANGRTHTRMQKITHAERQAAADRLQAEAVAAGLATITAFPAIGTLDPATGIPDWYLVGPNGQLVPDYSGFETPNFANSPMPVVVTVPGVEVAAGNELIARTYPTDTATAVFVILPSPLPLGQVLSFQVYNQAGSGPNAITGYVLRPTVNANEYEVVYQSAVLDIPAVDAAGEGVLDFALDVPVDVLAGDLIAFYGRGVPLTIGGGSDILIYPPPAQTAITGTFTTATPFSTDRTYSFGARVLDNTLSTTTIENGLRKFVDGLPLLDTPNNLGQKLPVAVPEEWCSRPEAPAEGCVSADYYEIAFVEYREQMHSDLPAVVGGKMDPGATGGTKLRGYVQESNGVPIGDPHYLGPVILAQKGRPVRVKFTNRLPIGEGGDLFIPVDKSLMGAGAGHHVTDAIRMTADGQNCTGGVEANCYTDNRGTIHLHGGVTPWISDGTTHQWITPANESTPYPEGVSVRNVPDMGTSCDAANDGCMTYYYTNDQSARLMFYHEHAHGITRLGVYAGGAAGYLITDDADQDLINGTNGTGINPELRKVLPDIGIPLVIQDKTFIDETTIRQQDPTWNWGTGPWLNYTDSEGISTMIRQAVRGDLWWPHVYQPAQDPYSLDGVNPMGRWVYGPWFWPPTTDIPFPEIPNPYYQPECESGETAPGCTMPWQRPTVPGTPNPSVSAEAFFDTPVVNGTVYPYMNVDPKPYRFRILNAAHDRFWNLSLYEASYAAGQDTTAFPYPTEVELNPAEVAAAKDDPFVVFPTPVAPPGPDWFYIGSEGGFLPKPVRVPAQPITWVNDPTVFNAGNVDQHSLLLGPAERADVIVDFCAYAGKTLILYNDAPAAFPARDPRFDYYTDSADLRDTGGVNTIMAGYGPNTRTVMQIRVAPLAEGQSCTPPDQAFADLVAAWMPRTFTPEGGEPTAVPGVFENSQDRIIVGQDAYDGVYSGNLDFPATYPNWGLARIQDTAVSFETVDGQFVTLSLGPKAIQDEMGEAYDIYGRMNAGLGVEKAVTTATNQNFVLYGYADPPTELIRLSKEPATGTEMIGQADDGTQIWKITHNGVDTHPVHVHLFHVQLLNRVGWDGGIRLPHPTELGWKDTVRVSPLEDTIVAIRPIAPRPEDLPAAWGELPNSFRPFEPSLPLGSTLMFKTQDPDGNPVTITNQIANFGWEYIWHCHILSHEENDMMRAIGFAAPPTAPTGLTAVASGGNRIVLTWADNSDIESGYLLERALDTGFTSGLTTFNLAANTTTYTDRTSSSGAYAYRIRALNTIGSDVPGFPKITATSEWNTFLYGAVPAPPDPVASFTASATLVGSGKKASETVNLTWTEVTGATGYTIERATNSSFTAGLSTTTVAAGTTTLTQSGLARVAYYYRIRANAGAAYSTWLNAVPFPLPPV